MTMHEKSLMEGQVVDERTEITIVQLCKSCAIEAELVKRLVAEGIIEPIRQEGDTLFFPQSCMKRTRIVLRLRSDLGVNMAGAAVWRWNYWSVLKNCNRGWDLRRPSPEGKLFAAVISASFVDAVKVNIELRECNGYSGVTQSLPQGFMQVGLCPAKCLHHPYANAVSGNL